MTAIVAGVSANVGVMISECMDSNHGIALDDRSVPVVVLDSPERPAVTEPGQEAGRESPAVAVAAGTGHVAEIPIAPPSGVAEVWGAGSPLLPFADGLIRYARMKGVDYRIPVAMAVLESSAGRQACGGNAWGLGSCLGKYGQIQGFDEGYRLVIDNLASPLYAGLTSRQVFCQWVSGDRNCSDAHSQEYAAKGLKLMENIP